MAKGKYTRKKSKKPVWRIAVIVISLLLVVVLAIFAIPQWLYRLNGESEDFADSYDSGQSQEYGSENETVSAETALETEISFPMSVAEGKLEITSIYTYDGINPDCSNQEGSDIVSIMVKNTSDTYLAEGRIMLSLSDGTTANFRVTDLPAGKTMMAFSTENAVLAADAVCLDVTCEGVFDPEATMSESAVTVSTDGMTVHLTNVSGRDLKKVVVYCHDTLEPDYFGGITYMYSVENLTVGATVTVDAVDCILGLAEVVRIDAE